jgi:hypothetical protein
MNGRIRIAFAREPSYFGAAGVDGKQVQVGVCRDTVSGRVVGMGSRAISPRYVEEQPRSIGYLSGLRLLPEHRGQGRLLARGYQFLRDLHADREADFYLTTIADENTAAIRLLTSGRAGLPVYHPWGRYSTLAIRPRAAAPGMRSLPGGPHFRTATIADRDMLVEFWHRFGKLRQFFPVYEAADLFCNAGLLSGLRPEDVALAFLGEELVATLAVWDQRNFKQTIVHGYDGWLAFGRPLYNAYARMMRRPVLPRPGSTLSCAVAAVPIVRGDDVKVFRLLLQWQLSQLRDRGVRTLLLGLHQDDPLMPAARKFTSVEFVTRLYVVYWPEDSPNLAAIMNRVPYLELGCL